MGPAELLQRLQEPAVELRRPAPARLPAGRLRRRLSLLVLAAFDARLTIIIILRRVGVGGAAGPVAAAVTDHGRARRGRRRGRQRQFATLLLLVLVLLERLERAPRLPVGVERHRPARQQQLVLVLLLRRRLLLVTPELHGL